MNKGVSAVGKSTKKAHRAKPVVCLTQYRSLAVAKGRAVQGAHEVRPLSAVRPPHAPPVSTTAVSGLLEAASPSPHFFFYMYVEQIRPGPIKINYLLLNSHAEFCR